jgi:hypothetical protein
METMPMNVFPREFFHYRLVIMEGRERFHLYPAHITDSKILVILPDQQDVELNSEREYSMRLESRIRREPLDFAGEIEPMGEAVYRGYNVRMASVVPAQPLSLTDDMIAVQMAVDAS